MNISLQWMKLDEVINLLLDRKFSPNGALGEL